MKCSKLNISPLHVVGVVSSYMICIVFTVIDCEVGALKHWVGTPAVSADRSTLLHSLYDPESYGFFIRTIEREHFLVLSDQHTYLVSPTLSSSHSPPSFLQQLFSSILSSHCTYLHSLCLSLAIITTIAT